VRRTSFTRMRDRWSRMRHKRIWSLSAALAIVAISVGAILAGATSASISSPIEMDGNLYPGPSPVTICPSSGATNPTEWSGKTDWVADCSATTTSTTLVAGTAQTGLGSVTWPGTTVSVQTGATGGFGDWNGVRIVDGLGNQDQDIFCTGGKENDLTTWNVCPASVGSSKFDISETYLANDASNLFFGMERPGNNGTTAFDFEFNQAEPTHGNTLSSSCTLGTTLCYVPNRSQGDVLWTFEMTGSGNTGSAVPHFFTFVCTTPTTAGQLCPNDTGTFVEGTPPSGTVDVINASPTPGGPWGFVNDKGNWVTSTDPTCARGSNCLQNFEFAEAKVPLSSLPGVSPCGGRAFVNVRTRSSATSTSDLKDTTPYFLFAFGSPSLGPAVKTGADGTNQNVTVAVTSSANISSPSFQWQQGHVTSGTTSWSNISGATSSTYVYDFSTPTPSSATTAFTLNSTSYTGQLFQSLFRLHASEVITVGTTCTADSAGVTVAKVQGVDP
jgi:hypothetical protein